MWIEPPRPLSAPLVHSLSVLPQAVLYSLVRMIGAVITGQLSVARAAIGAWGWNITKPGSLLRRRRLLRRRFGGGWSLQLALNEPQLDAAVIYYGRLETDPTVLQALSAPVLGHFGDQDKGIPRESVQAFHDAAKSTGNPVTVHMYPAGHAFANPSGTRYQPEAADDAWRETLGFLATHLQP